MSERIAIIEDLRGKNRARNNAIDDVDGVDLLETNEPPPPNDNDNVDDDDEYGYFDFWFLILISIFSGFFFVLGADDNYNTGLLDETV